MDAFQSLLQGFAIALQPINLLMALIGSALGTAIGVLPGIGPALTIALLLPVTVKLAPEAAFIMFAGILYGAMYGGSTTSILINAPGSPPRRSGPSSPARSARSACPSSHRRSPNWPTSSVPRITSR
jgi:TctA family transporter